MHNRELLQAGDSLSISQFGDSAKLGHFIMTIHEVQGKIAYVAPNYRSHLHDIKNKCLQIRSCRCFLCDGGSTSRASCEIKVYGTRLKETTKAKIA